MWVGGEQGQAAWLSLPHPAPCIHPPPCFQPQNVCAGSCRSLTKQGGPPKAPAVFSCAEEHWRGPWGPLHTIGLLASTVSPALLPVSAEELPVWAWWPLIPLHPTSVLPAPRAVSLQQKLPLDSMHFKRGPRFWHLPTPWEDQTRGSTGTYTSSVDLGTAGSVNWGPPHGISWCHQECCTELKISSLLTKANSDKQILLFYWVRVKYLTNTEKLFLTDFSLLSSICFFSSIYTCVVLVFVFA